MTQEHAQKEASKHLNNPDVKTLCVLSDGGVYINNDLEVMKQNALDRGKKIFIFKGETEKLDEVVAEQVEEVKTEEPKKPKKK